MEELPKFITDLQVCELTGLKRQTLSNQRHCKRGIPFYRVGRSIRYRVSDIETYLKGVRFDYTTKGE